MANQVRGEQVLLVTINHHHAPLESVDLTVDPCQIALMMRGREHHNGTVIPEIGELGDMREITPGKDPLEYGVVPAAAWMPVAPDNRCAIIRHCEKDLDSCSAYAL